MYLRFFKKHSPGRKIYGYGFIINYKTHTLIIGTKKREYRNSKKNYKNFAKKIWRRKKFFVSYRK
jgi:hypothetical protein